ncbi:Fibronectin type III domain-containing protein [Goodfellowiella coeruleoviolacea]|uniref:Fibronectin type III domain-containing protein n=2 Tax=Goodfellowiella coeruleoviolacea TaxID=334858 RepID=A0AAE3KIH1_9PSEU|nr:Fibronectin type III domain-containing protein [Goodfellowiella coeruleoviolacea]
MRRPRWLTALALAVTLVVAGTAQPAEAAGEACATAGSSFDSQTIAAGTAGLRMGCARDAGALRSLASSDTDLVAAIDFNTSPGPDVWQHQMRQVVDTVRADQSKGLTLSESLTLMAQRNSVGFYERQSGVRYNGSIQIVGDSLVIVAPAGEVSTAANWWQKFIASTVGVAVSLVVVPLCTLFFAPGAVIAVLICGAVGGGLGGLITELMNAYFDGRSLGDGDVWAEAVAVAVVGALTGGFLGSMLKWANAQAGSVVSAVQETTRNFITRLGSWSNPLPYIQGLLNGDFARKLVENLVRLAERGVGDVAWPSTIRVMVVGDSISQGHEGDYTWRYRLSQWFQENHVGVDFVGPYHGTFTPDQPAPPKPPLLPGEKPQSEGIRVNGGYAAGVAFDSDHFALWGKQAAQMKNEIRAQVATYQPDLILLALGFNDMGWFVSDEAGTLDSVESIVDQVRAAKPDVHFALANVPHRSRLGGREDLIEKTDKYARLLDDATARWNKGISRVELVDWMTAYSCSPDSCPAAYDGLHPNSLGEVQLAGAFAGTLHDKYGLGEDRGPVPPGQLPVRPTPAPTNLKAVSSPLGVTVTWDPVYGAFGYDVRSRIAGQTTWSEGRTNTNRTDTTWTVDGIQWEYQVRTVGGDDVKGPWTETVSAVAHPQTAPPPQNIISRPVDRNSIEVEITPPTGPYTDTIDRYGLLLFDKDEPGAFLTGTGFRGNRVRVDGLDGGHHYSVAVVTWNAVGGGLPGGARPVTVGASTPPAPTNLQVSTMDPTTVELNWRGSLEAAGYRLWVQNINESGSTPHADENIIDGTKYGVAFLFPGVWNYKFCVTAVNGAYESARSNCVIPDRPVGSAASAQSSTRPEAPANAMDANPFAAVVNPDGTRGPVPVDVAVSGGDR